MNLVDEIDSLLQEGGRFLAEARLGQAEGCLNRAVSLALAAEQRVGEVLLAISEVYLAQGRYFLVDELLEEASDEQLEAEQQSRYHGLMGHYHTLCGERNQARESFSEALNLVEQNGLPGERLLTCLLDLAWFNHRHGNERARVLFKRAVELADTELGIHPDGLVSALNGLARCHLKEERCLRAEQLLNRAFSVIVQWEADHQHHHPERGLTFHSLALFQLKQRELAEGLQSTRLSGLPVGERMRQASTYMAKARGRAHPQRCELLFELFQHLDREGDAEAVREVGVELLGNLKELHPGHPLRLEFEKSNPEQDSAPVEVNNL